MAKVAIVENGKVVYRGVLPRVWKNSSGLHNSRDDWVTLKEIGIYPLEEHMPGMDLDTEVLDGWTEDIQADKVVLTNIKRDKTSAELTADAESAAKVSKVGDGVIVGSVIVNLIAKNKDDKVAMNREIKALVSSMRIAMDA